jgi:hypothetical protein
MKTSRYGRAAVVATVVGLLGLAPLSAVAQVESAQVRIDGMT